MQRMCSGMIGIAALAWVQAANAGVEPIIAPVPSWVKPPTLPDAKADPNATFLLLDREFQVGRTGTVSYFEAASRINSPESLMRAVNLQLSWQPDKGDLFVHRIELIHPNATVDILKSGQKFAVLRREAQLEQLQVNGVLTATMQIEGAQVGDIVRLAFSISYKDPAMAGNANSIQQLAFPGPAPVKSQLRAVWDNGLPVRWKVGDTRVIPRITKSASETELVISGDIPKTEPAPADAPVRYRLPPMLELTTFADWKSVSATNAPLYQTADLIKKDVGLSAEVTRIAATSPDPRTRAALALQLVQDKVRYLFNGMALGAYVPATPSETWARKFGDCKAKTMLLVALLRELGIEAEPMLVNATTRGSAADRLPAFQAFDHIVARAHIGGKWLWLDGTSLGDRAADLDDIPAFEVGLPVRSGGADLETLIATPISRPESVTDLDYDARAGLAFPTIFTARQVIRGQAAMILRASRDGLGPKEFAKVQIGMIQQIVPDSPVTEHAIKFDEATGEVVLTGKGIATLDWSPDEGRQAYEPTTMLGSVSLSADRSTPGQTSIPVAVAFPDYNKTRVTIQLPNKGAGFTITGPQKYVGTIGGIELGLDSSLKDGVLELTQSQRALVPQIAAASLPEARAALAKAQATALKIAAPASYPDNKAERAAAKKDGRLTALKAIYAGLVPVDDQDSTPFLNRARFYAGIEETKLALVDVDKLIARAPSAENYLWRARLRGKDNQPGALADIAAARALEPASTDAISQLVALRLEKKDSAAALADIENAMASGPDKASLFRLKASVLEDANKLDEALAALDKAIALAPGTPDILNERCWMKATHNVQLDTALRDCTKAIEQMDEPAAALDSRGFVYLRLARFDDAIGDFDLALKRRPDLGPTLYARGIARLRKGDKAGGDADLANARRLVPEIDKTYAKYGVSP